MGEEELFQGTHCMHDVSEQLYWSRASVQEQSMHTALAD